ncbi:MAG: hypothetical protein ACD_87C00012G0001 [uncultured bacterium]|nr:MAG: hypothetical protein ACD_87C00012G0001 [uncultured bacterium]
MLAFRLGNTDIVEIGGTENHHHASPFLPRNPFRVPGHFGGMTDAAEVPFEVAFHFHGHPVFQEIPPLGEQFRRKLSQALLGVLAIGCTTEIHPRVDHLMPAMMTLAGGLVFEKLNRTSAFGAGGVENGPRLPVARVLSRALHG